MSGITASDSPGQTLIWIKSSYSGGEGNECVEVAFLSGTTAIRDSKAPRHGALSLSNVAFTACIEALKE